MKLTDKLNMTYEELIKNGPITIVAFGDSVTHGAVASGEMNYETVYWNRLRQKILEVKNYVPVNVINAGIGGISAKTSVDRMDAQVLAHTPDIIIVCFGLNDVNDELENYINSLKIIFEKGKKSGAEVIFMTPNMLNTYVAEDTPEQYREYAEKTAGMQNSGKMDLYIKSAVTLSEEMNIPVCDCYSAWKELAKTKDTTLLLANRINHPTKEMHELFANMLFDLIFKDNNDLSKNTESTMYKG